MVLLKLESVLISLTPVTIKGYMDALESGLPPRAMFTFKDFAAFGSIRICMACAATWDNGDIQVQVRSAATKSHIQDLGLVHLSIYPTYDLLHCVKRLDLLNSTHRISMTQGGQWTVRVH